MVEGAFYCPSMPKNLVEATVQFRGGQDFMGHLG